MLKNLTHVPLQDELDDILRYGAAELFADAVAASQQAEQVAGTSTDQGTNPRILCISLKLQLQVCAQHL